jgi:hypothetical protein
MLASLITFTDSKYFFGELQVLGQDLVELRRKRRFTSRLKSFNIYPCDL